MDNFRYKAKDEKGKNIVGIMRARDEQEVHDKLKVQGLYLIEAKNGTKTHAGIKRMRYDRLAEFSRNLSKFLGAGITLIRALTIISEDEALKPQEAKIYREILRLVRGGMPLSDALAEQGDTFPLLFINMMRSTESSGNMDRTAAQMADYYDKEYRLTQKVKSAMVYPKILGVLIIIVVAIIMGFVIPQFSSLFEQMDKLPVATTILLAISNFVATKWYVIIFVVFFIYVILHALSSIPAVKIFKGRMELHLPAIGKLKKVIYTARFARTLSSLYSAGIPIVTCLSIAKTTIGNLYIENQFDDMIAEIRAGGNLSDSIRKVDGFVKKLASTVAVGEETGQLDTMLTSIANSMDYDSEMATERMVSLLEPIMIVIMAVVVGFVMIAIIQPIYGSYKAISNQGM